ncbi:Leucine Rich Repeat [Seminavis robusta]|uniref:Leucine Rich Repeat n=1 Tax=Seminavis robusta TaxID=568900 RepID=A0A9N8EQ16_9STRA|nr:Leucine Rich Repeat [Seminavis robusta]|eukprot:Sro1569_g283150.1 Leucine Rich Repeat (786) ;mRNA; f:13528-16101
MGVERGATEIVDEEAQVAKDDAVDCTRKFLAMEAAAAVEPLQAAAVGETMVDDTKSAKSAELVAAKRAVECEEQALFGSKNKKVLNGITKAEKKKLEEMEDTPLSEAMNVAESTDAFDPIDGIMAMPTSRTNVDQEGPGAYARSGRPIFHHDAEMGDGATSSVPELGSPSPMPMNNTEEVTSSAPPPPQNAGLAVANRVHEVLPQDLPQAHNYDAGQQSARKRQLDQTQFRTFILLLVILLIAITVIIVAVLVPANNNEDPFNPEQPPNQIQESEFPTGAPTILAETWQGLPDYTLTALQDPVSPQARAYEWVLNDPHRTSYPQWKILQRFALAVFYFSTGGDRWILRKDWLDYNVDECSWYFRNFLSGVEDFFIHEGVTDTPSTLQIIDSVCDSQGRYMYIIFTENNMHGTLPPELSLLSDSLISLEVGSNQDLFGDIPSEIGLLTNLQQFYANRNQHSGQIPTEVGQLSHLQAIELGYNPFTGSLPSEMGNMQALSFLSVRQCDQMTGIMPTELYRLTNMVSLYIHGLDLVTSAKLLPDIGKLTKLENIKTYPLPFNTSIPTEIGLLTNMLRMNFWKSQITGSVPSELFLLTNMKRIDIDANALTGTIPTEFGLFPNLTMAWMDGNRFSGTVPGSIFENWGKLTLLAINNNDLEGPLPSEIGLLTSIEALRLSHNDFSGSIPSEFGLLNDLTELFLHDTNVTGNIPETLVDMGALEHLTLSNTSLTGSIPDGLCDRVWDMTYTCNEYYGGVYTICYDAERVNFTCSSTDLCGCDACGACNATG